MTLNEVMFLIFLMWATGFVVIVLCWGSLYDILRKIEKIWEDNHGRN